MPQTEGHKQHIGAVIAPGNYDGVHRGHQVLLERARAMADRFGVGTRVVTFYPHPAALLAPEQAPETLTPPERRRELLLGYGVDEVEVVEFTREYAAQTPREFIERMRAGGARGFVVGHDFRFGRRAQGDTAFLQTVGQEEGFAVDVVDPVLDHVTHPALRISSTAVRDALRAGAVREATMLLGRVYDIAGEVVRGDQRGRLLGFPTANLHGGAAMHPDDGVYAVAVRRLAVASDAPLLWGVANLGKRPTFAAGRSVEVHLLDFDAAIYGETLRIGFVARIRGEQRFDGVDALKAQIMRDCDSARAVLATAEQRELRWI